MDIIYKTIQERQSEIHHVLLLNRAWVLTFNAIAEGDKIVNYPDCFYHDLRLETTHLLSLKDHSPQVGTLRETEHSLHHVVIDPIQLRYFLVPLCEHLDPP
jgi:hypothetical protein